MYDDLEYAQGRLVGTVVRDGDGEPVYVGEVEIYDGSIEVCCTPLKDDKISDLSFNDFIDLEYCRENSIDINEVSLASPPLGYCNTRVGPVYVSRQPLRRDWRQGIARGNLNTRVFTFGELRKTILGEYPTFIWAAANPLGGAWHRHFAVKDGEIHYRGEKVGLSSDSPTLIEGYEWLEEYLKESLEGQFVL